MGKSGPILLLTRPESASERLAASLETDADILIAPVMEIVAEGEAPDLSDLAAIVLTSANAARRLKDVPPGLVAYCVGDETARMARAAGCRAVSAGGDADALVARILRERPGGRLVHLRGALSRGDVDARLSEAGLSAESRIVYRQEARTLEGAARSRLERAGAIVAPVYSPASAGALAATWPDAAPPPYLVAISPAAAEAWGRPTRGVRIAAAPDGAAMLTAIRQALAEVGPCS